jgi:peptidoglycan/LPS O-acetylase OafA/YrhL
VAERKQILPYIDGLRGVAILMVIAYHLAAEVGAQFAIGPLQTVFGSGHRGVQLFFILSAFTLFASSQKRFKTDRLPILSFYIRRIFRIVPFWLLVNVIWALILLPNWTTVASSATFAFGFLRFIPGYELVPGGWSLFVEETFYLFLPLIFGFISSTRRALGLAILLFVISELWWRFASQIQAFSHANFIFFAPPAHWFAFGLGILLFFVATNERVRTRLLENRVAYYFLDAATLVAGFFLLSGEYRLATLSLLLVVFASIPSRTMLGRIMRLGLLRRLGRYSYSIYLLHFLFLITLLPVRDWLWRVTGAVDGPAELKLAVYLPVFCAVMLVVGFLSFNLFEKPFIDMGRRLNAWINRRRAQPATQAEMTAL